jgi:hypothetical protein
MLKAFGRYLQSIYDEAFADSDRPWYIQMAPELPSVVALFILIVWEPIENYLFPGLSIISKLMYLLVFSLFTINGVTIIWCKRAMVFVRGIPAIIIGVFMLASGGMVVLYMIQQLLKP